MLLRRLTFGLWLAAAMLTTGCCWCHHRHCGYCAAPDLGYLPDPAAVSATRPTGTTAR